MSYKLVHLIELFIEDAVEVLPCEAELLHFHFAHLGFWKDMVGQSYRRKVANMITDQFTNDDVIFFYFIFSYSNVFWEYFYCNQQAIGEQAPWGFGLVPWLALPDEMLGQCPPPE